MSNYIEREEQDNNYNCSEDIPSKDKKMDEENIERWSWLIDEWDNMTFMERMSIFMPYHHYVNLRNSWKREFDDILEAELIAIAYEKCRVFEELKFDPDGQGAPNLIFVYKPIDISSIPNERVKSSIKNWGMKYGFITESGCNRHSCYKQ